MKFFLFLECGVDLDVTMKTKKKKKSKNVEIKSQKVLCWNVARNTLSNTEVIIPKMILGNPDICLPFQ